MDVFCPFLFDFAKKKYFLLFTWGKKTVVRFMAEVSRTLKYNIKFIFCSVRTSNYEQVLLLKISIWQPQQSCEQVNENFKLKSILLFSFFLFRNNFFERKKRNKIRRRQDAIDHQKLLHLKMFNRGCSKKTYLQISVL